LKKGDEIIIVTTENDDGEIALKIFILIMGKSTLIFRFLSIIVFTTLL
jgi:hypothetical protein